MKHLMCAALFCSIVLSACSDDDSGNFLAKGDTSSNVRSSSIPSSSSQTSVKYVSPCEDECEYGVLEDERDGQTYRTVRIGEQIWMSDNLNYRPEGGLLYDSLLKCVPNADSVCIDYGALYTWAEAIDSAYVYRTEGMTCGYNASCDLEPPVRGICPKGWHLPSADEFSELYASMNKKYYAMQAKNFSEWENATDSYGFSAIPVGYVHQGKHGYIGTNLGFWTSSGDDSSGAHSWYVHSHKAGPTIDSKDHGYSIRCVQD